MLTGTSQISTAVTPASSHCERRSVMTKALTHHPTRCKRHCCQDLRSSLHGRIYAHTTQAARNKRHPPRDRKELGSSSSTPSSRNLKKPLEETPAIRLAVITPKQGGAERKGKANQNQYKRQDVRSSGKGKGNEVVFPLLHLRRSTQPPIHALRSSVETSRSRS